MSYSEQGASKEQADAPNTCGLMFMIVEEVLKLSDTCPRYYRTPGWPMADVVAKGGIGRLR
eukprot:7139923-Prymnesium_polylepis.1